MSIFSKSSSSSSTTNYNDNHLEQNNAANNSQGVVTAGNNSTVTMTDYGTTAAAIAATKETTKAALEAMGATTEKIADTVFKNQADALGQMSHATDKLFTAVNDMQATKAEAENPATSWMKYALFAVVGIIAFKALAK